jgi:protein-tyrosine phosphatase
MGNICRSPTAEGVFTHLVQQQGFAEWIEVDSAGTIAYHAGEAPDPRSQREAARRGVSIAHQRARGLEPQDYHRFDYIVAMDHANMSHLKRHCPDNLRHKLFMCTQFAPHLNIEEVPDPYYDEREGFVRVFDIVYASSEGLLRHICAEREREPQVNTNKHQ